MPWRYSTCVASGAERGVRWFLLKTLSRNRTIALFRIARFPERRDVSKCGGNCGGDKTDRQGRIVYGGTITWEQHCLNDGLRRVGVSFLCSLYRVKIDPLAPL